MLALKAAAVGAGAVGMTAFKVLLLCTGTGHLKLLIALTNDSNVRRPRWQGSVRLAAARAPQCRPDLGHSTTRPSESKSAPAGSAASSVLHLRGAAIADTSAGSVVHSITLHY